MFSALAEGKSRVTNFLRAQDCLSTISAFRALGVSIEDHADGTVIIEGQGLHGLKQPDKELYMGNSGTTMRLLMGILAGQSFIATLTGDASLSMRPMGRVADPLRKMGAKIQSPKDKDICPLSIKGGALSGIDYTNDLGSAQVKSAILLAGLYAEGQTIVREPIPSRDHTERMLELYGANFERDGTTLQVSKTERLNPQDIVVPGDPSSAAFFAVAGCLVPDSELVIKNVGLNPGRIGFLEVLKEMGADISIENRVEGCEPVGDIRVRSSKLTGVKISRPQIPSLIDELPILMVACSRASGASELRGAKELRVKETDRIKAICENLGALGVAVKELDDGCVIEGGASFRGAKTESFGDHRMAMAMAVAATVADEPVEIFGSEAVDISYPAFFDDWLYEHQN